MENEMAALWSAIAASFAAFSSFMIYKNQIRTLNFAHRPDIVLGNWSRTEGKYPEQDVIRFSQIENIGTGNAQHIHINAFETAEDERLIYMLSTTAVVSTLVKGAVLESDCTITLNWKSVPLYQGESKHILIKLRVLYWDVVGIRHAKKYELFVVKDFRTHTVGNAVAPGVMLMPLQTISTPVWQLKLFSKFAKFPIVGKYCKDKLNA